VPIEMMLKDLAAIQQQQQLALAAAADENMSNLTSASGDLQTSVSSHPLPPPSSKRKRSLPGNPGTPTDNSPSHQSAISRLSSCD
jgi:hypothetical protein